MSLSNYLFTVQLQDHTIFDANFLPDLTFISHHCRTKKMMSYYYLKLKLEQGDRALKITKTPQMLQFRYSEHQLKLIKDK